MDHFILFFYVLYLAAGSPQYLYQAIQKYVVIVLMKLYRSNSSDKFLTNRISIILWRKMCLVLING